MTENNPTPTPRAVAHPKPATAPIAPVDDSQAAHAATFGRVDSERNVWLKEADGSERIVGQYAVDGSEKEAMDLYVRRFLDLQAQVALLETRISHISPEEARQSLKALQEQLVEPAVIGDVAALKERAAKLEILAEERKQIVAAERKAAKEQALAERTAIVERAEEIADQNPAQTHWKNSRQELSDLLDAWKNAQRNGARIDRPAEEDLWKRFSSARTKFDRHRRQYFSERDAAVKQTVTRKEELIAEAEELSTSTEWGPTAARYRELMDAWKAAGRSIKKEDDRLWERFRTAQQVFFDARTAHNSALDEEFGANLQAKLALLEEAEKLLPISDVEYAKEQIRSIGERWDAIGRVPRGDVARTEGRLRDIEHAIRDAESELWRKSDPEKEERTNGMAAQLQALIAELEIEIAQAQAAGNEKKVKELTASLEARKTWLAAVLAE
ncbi:DUF349 domain-containing protein [Arcanobacterium phocisimile]|uniref:DUF349 domain-containing protein n=1 Tax=Arcanobacterium phocisimile TaxID=1302235 RepID=A0ABX7IIH0_9ACTO|nr:DUF349 domain-containing protein [Arcanobacterium phocisimile]QRV02921.1 DUF349 domain-containing protein [Arcanobacterium phocisimile]